MTPSLIEFKNISKYFDEEQILKNVDFSVYSGEFLTLLGPSGCGKTTLLRLLSGFEQPTTGDLLIHGKSINHLSPQQRNLHTVFQSYALFPHLSVFDNIAFPLVCQKKSREAIHTRVNEMLQLTRLEKLATRHIKQLSGGQQQRVAIARAVINRPEVLLLDEPLSSLDYRLRKSMQYELKQLQKALNITFIFVTHDQDEALSLSDRIIVLNQGNIEQIGTPREVYETPSNLFVAQFIGETNIFDIEVKKLDKSLLYTSIEGINIACNNTGSFKKNDSLHLIVRPEDIRVYHQSEIDDNSNMLPGKITDIVYKGTTVDLKVTLPSGHILNASEFFDEDDEELEFALDEPVWVHWLTGWEVLLPHEK